LPEELGPWGSVYTRFNRWCKNGVFQKALTSLQEDVDWEWLMLDSSTVRAHHACVAKKKKKINTSGNPLVALRRKSI